MLGSGLTLQQKQLRHQKIQKFFGYIHYNWGDETKGSSVNEKTGTGPWQIYKQVHNWINASEEARQHLKRTFYNENVDKEFEKVVRHKNETDRKEFMEYCTLYNSLGEFGFQAPTGQRSSVANTKRSMYLIYLLLQPMNVPYSWSLFLIAAFMSFLERNQIIGNVTPVNGVGMLQSFIEEECMNIFLMMFLIPAGSIMRFIIHSTLAIWATIHVGMLAEAQLQSDPNTIGLASLRGIISQIVLSKTEFIMLKNQIEILMMFVCVPMVLLGKVAVVFPIMYFQYIRVKFVSNQFQKQAFKELVEKLKKIIPVPVWDSAPIAWFRGWLWSYVEFDDQSDKKNDDSSQSQSFLGSEASSQCVQGDKHGTSNSLRKNPSQVQLGKGIDDKKGKKQEHNSQRVFVNMMYDKEFQTDFNMSNEFPDMGGATVEEVEMEDLD